MSHESMSQQVGSAVFHTVSTKCRLQTGYKMQTEFKMQTDKKKLLFCFRNEITFDFVSYQLSRNNLTMSSPVNNTILNSLSLSLFFRNVILPHGSVLIYF